MFLPRYLLKVVHFENSGDSYVEVGAKFYDTEFTSVWTGKAEQETQTIAITSTVVNEVQVGEDLHLSLSMTKRTKSRAPSEDSDHPV